MRSIKQIIIQRDVDFKLHIFVSQLPASDSSVIKGNRERERERDTGERDKERERGEGKREGERDRQTGERVREKGRDKD